MKGCVGYRFDVCVLVQQVCVCVIQQVCFLDWYVCAYVMCYSRYFWTGVSAGVCMVTASKNYFLEFGVLKSAVSVAVFWSLGGYFLLFLDWGWLFLEEV